MTGIAARLYDAAEVAERAAVAIQHAELDGPRFAPALIGGLELAADTLRHAAKPLGPPPVASRGLTTRAMFMNAVMTFSIVTMLLAVPHRAQPLVLAVTFAGTVILAMLAGDLFDAIRDRRYRRTLAAAGNEPEDLQATVAELRRRIRAITDALEPDRDDTHLEVGRRIESVDVWLDAAEDALAEAAER